MIEEEREKVEQIREQALEWLRNNTGFHEIDDMEDVYVTDMVEWMAQFILENDYIRKDDSDVVKRIRKMKSRYTVAMINHAMDADNRKIDGSKRMKAEYLVNHCKAVVVELKEILKRSRKN